SNISKSTGSLATDILLINAVLPLLFTYGKSRDCYDVSERVLLFLETIKWEENSITEEWKRAGIVFESAFYSQALIQLRNGYCKIRKCLDCRIGNKLIRMGEELKKDEELLLET
ncbi:MAG: DUF2851 family protein, partial [Desulfobacterales bacterium]|nr:DUF2851 family protein [Desulfobacterales bacterium]